MFGFLWRRKMRIYKYWNGSAWRWVDPLVLSRDIDKAGGEKWADSLDVLRLSAKLESTKLPPNAVAEQGKASEAAVATLVAIVRKVFDAPEIDTKTGNGVTEAECLDLLCGFLVWMNEAGADARPGQSSPPPTEPSPANSEAITV